MDNLERLKMELRGVTVPDNELIVYLLENDLINTDPYDPKSKTNLRNIIKTALSVLESIANDTNLMKDYKTEDITITNFYESLLSRIDDLRKKINTMATDEVVGDNDARFIPFIK